MNVKSITSMDPASIRNFLIIVAALIPTLLDLSHSFTSVSILASSSYSILVGLYMLIVTAVCLPLSLWNLKRDKRNKWLVNFCLIAFVLLCLARFILLVARW